MLEISNLSVRRGRLTVVKAVSLRIAAGEVVSVIGTNGAGKSSLMLSVAGLVPAEAGEIRFDGERIDGLKPERRSELGVALVPEGRWLFPDMTVEECLRLGAFRKDLRAQYRQSMDTVFGLFPRLAERRSQVVSTLSGGEQQMVSIGRALMTRPKLLLLDEPSIGLAPIVVRQVFEALGRIIASGLTVVLVEQNVEQALRFSHRAYVLTNGAVTLEGSSKELLNDPRIVDAYLSV
ncbi:MAG: ABC transporter ATP-binding protein [Rhizobiaceae bacterium]|nr:ABC transporter ATP-binding protein [Rhizobiaceae bacterium]